MAQSGESNCRHRWQNESGDPLACAGCGVLWPGYPLPDPWRPRVLGYGEVLNGFVPWAKRVERVTRELEAIG